jgi:large subunit ribosomal protein L1
MGKVRVTAIGDETQEVKDREEHKKKKEQKDSSKIHLSGMEGGARVKLVGPTEEELAALDEKKEESAPEATEGEKPKTKKQKFAKTKKRSANYSAKIIQIDKNKPYSLPDALELLQKVHLAKFDEAVELHINTVSDGISGQVKLPHGTGKEVKVAIATDAVLVDVEKGKIDFDILIATPDMMPKMAKVARVLGPKGLMPNPKNGTISAKPEEAAKAFQGGQMHYKTEAKMPVMHLVVGRLSFKNDELSENIKTVLSKIGKEKMRKVVLKSSMSPAIRLQV